MIARVSNLHKTEKEWLNHADFIPNAGELVIYDPDEATNFSRLKIGDGKTPLKDIDFLIASNIEDFIKKTKYSEFIDAGRITEYK